jgi:hypothetical protein
MLACRSQAFESHGCVKWSSAFSLASLSRAFWLRAAFLAAACFVVSGVYTSLSGQRLAGVIA